MYTLNKSKIIILCQPEYFRQCVYDLVLDRLVQFFPISSGDPATLIEGLKAAQDSSVDFVIVFRPEWLVPFADTVSDLRKRGVRVVGVSSEPVPYDFQAIDDIHGDQVNRLVNLCNTNRINLDLIVHYDCSSKCVLEGCIDSPLIFIPLPLSNQLFNAFDVPIEKKFDSIFLGRSTDYRETFLMYPKMLHRHLHVAHGLTDELSAFFIKQSFFSINIHNLSYPGFEIRVMQSLMCGTPVVSERLSRDEFSLTCGLYYISNPSDLLEFVHVPDMLKSPDPVEVSEHWGAYYDARVWLRKIIDYFGLT